MSGERGFAMTGIELSCREAEPGFPVIPAKAGIQATRAAVAVRLDPRLRGGDDGGNAGAFPVIAKPLERWIEVERDIAAACRHFAAAVAIQVGDDVMAEGMPG